MTKYPYLYYVNDYSGGVCVSSCPKLDGFLADPYTLVTYDGLFQINGSSNSNVTTTLIDIADYSNSSNNTLTCTTDVCYPDMTDPISSYTSIGVNGGKGFAYYALDTYEVMWRCVFRDEATKKLNAIVNPKTNNFTAEVVEDMTTQNEQIKQGYDIWHNLFGDLWETRYFILGLGFGAPLVVGFFYAFMLRIPGVLPIVVWVSILATIGIFFTGKIIVLQLPEPNVPLTILFTHHVHLHYPRKSYSHLKVRGTQGRLPVSGKRRIHPNERILKSWSQPTHRMHFMSLVVSSSSSLYSCGKEFSWRWGV